MTAARIDPEYVVQKERQWHVAVELLSGGPRVLLEGVDCWQAVEAHESHPDGLCDSQNFAGWCPPMANADTQRPDLEEL